MAAPCPRCGFGEQFCRAVITKKGDLSIAKGDRTTIERCLESFDKAPDGKDLALRVALSASTEKSAHKGCFSYYNKAKRQWQTDELPDRRHCNVPPAKRGRQSSIITKRSRIRSSPPVKKPARQRTDCIPRTASHCWALQREQNTPVHMWPFFQLNVKSPPVGGLLIDSDRRCVLRGGPFSD